MCEKVDFCRLLISLQGSSKDRLNIRGGNFEFSLGHGSCWEGEKRVVDSREREYGACVPPIWNDSESPTGLPTLKLAYGGCDAPVMVP